MATSSNAQAKLPSRTKVQGGEPERLTAIEASGGSAFDVVFERGAWEQRPAQAYEQWLQSRTIAGRSYAAKTVEQYKSLFGAFVRWLHTRQSSACHPGSELTLTTLQAGDLQQFVDGLRGRQGRDEASARHKGGTGTSKDEFLDNLRDKTVEEGASGHPSGHRAGNAASIRSKRVYLLEIARVLEFLRSQGWRDDNPARDLVRQLKEQEPMKFRNSALVGLPVRSRFLQALEREDPSCLPWDGVRSRTMALLMLELGLTLKEVQKLTLQDVARIEQGWLQAPGHRTLKSRTLSVPPVVQNWLGAWLQHRQTWSVHMPRVRRRKTGDPGQDAPVPRSDQTRVTLPSLSRVFVSALSPAGGRDQDGRRLAINRVDDRAIRQAANDALRLSVPNWPAGIVHGPQMLRNLCFQRLVLENPEDLGLVAHQMGLSDLQQVRWMARLVGVSKA